MVSDLKRNWGKPHPSGTTCHHFLGKKLLGRGMPHPGDSVLEGWPLSKVSMVCLPRNANLREAGKEIASPWNEHVQSRCGRLVQTVLVEELRGECEGVWSGKWVPMDLC